MCYIWIIIAYCNHCSPIIFAILMLHTSISPYQQILGILCSPMCNLKPYGFSTHPPCISLLTSLFRHLYVYLHFTPLSHRMFIHHYYCLSTAPTTTTTLPNLKPPRCQNSICALRFIPTLDLNVFHVGCF